MCAWGLWFHKCVEQNKMGKKNIDFARVVPLLSASVSVSMTPSKLGHGTLRVADTQMQ